MIAEASSIDDTMRRLHEANDSQGMAMVAAMSRFEQVLERRGWDCPAMLHIVFRNLPPRPIADKLQSEGMHGQFMEIVPTKIPLLGSERDIVRTLTRFAARMGNAPQGADVMAWMLSFEAWAGYADLNNRRAVAKLNMDAALGRISKRSDRKEFRVLAAVDRTRTVYQLARVRNHAPAIVITDEANDEMTRALTAIMDATP